MKTFQINLWMTICIIFMDTLLQESRAYLKKYSLEIIVFKDSVMITV